MGGRLCERFGGYKTINRIPLPLPFIYFAAPGHHLDTQTLNNHPSRYPYFLLIIPENVNFQYIIEFVYHIISPIAIYIDIVPNFKKVINIFLWL